MTEDLSFVPTLGTNAEYVPVNGVEAGTHTDCILKESLRPLRRYANSPQQIPLDSLMRFTENLKKKFFGKTQLTLELPETEA